MAGGEALDALVRKVDKLKEELKEKDEMYRREASQEILPVDGINDRDLSDAYRRLEGENLKLNDDPQAELDRWLESEQESILSGEQERMSCPAEEYRPRVNEVEKDEVVDEKAEVEVEEEIKPTE